MQASLTTLYRPLLRTRLESGTTRILGWARYELFAVFIDTPIFSGAFVDFLFVAFPIHMSI